VAALSRSSSNGERLPLQTKPLFHPTKKCSARETGLIVRHKRQPMRLPRFR
jgi:hypothetical protein